MYTFSNELISDLHKDARGYRPTEAFWNAWNFQDDEGKQAAWNVLIDELNETIAAEKEAEAKALVAFRKRVALTMQTCNCSWNKAVEYLADAEDNNLGCDQDFDYFLWGQGIGYADRLNIRKLYKEAA